MSYICSPPRVNRPLYPPGLYNGYDTPPQPAPQPAPQPIYIYDDPHMPRATHPVTCQSHELMAITAGLRGVNIALSNLSNEIRGLGRDIQDAFDNDYDSMPTLESISDTMSFERSLPVPPPAPKGPPGWATPQPTRDLVAECGPLTQSDDTTVPISVFNSLSGNFQMLQGDLEETRNLLTEFRDLVDDNNKSETSRGELSHLSDRLEESINQSLVRIREIHHTQEEAGMRQRWDQFAHLYDGPVLLAPKSRDHSPRLEAAESTPVPAGDFDEINMTDIVKSSEEEEDAKKDVNTGSSGSDSKKSDKGRWETSDPMMMMSESLAWVQ